MSKEYDHSNRKSIGVILAGFALLMALGSCVVLSGCRTNDPAPKDLDHWEQPADVIP